MKYSIILIEEELKDFFPDNPFNLKNDFKKIGIELKEDIIQEIAAQIIRGFNRKECIKLDYKINKEQNVHVILTKIKLSLVKKKKKAALRCISIIDEINNLCIVLHIYEKNKKKDLSLEELKLSKNILNNYYLRLLKEN